MSKLRVHAFSVSLDGYGAGPRQSLENLVLTHHPRHPVTMEGGTVFHFVTGGIDEALRQAVAVAGGRDVRLGGGVSTIRQYLRSRLVDEMHLAIAPTLLGSGEHLLGDVDLPALGYEVAEHVAGTRATHFVIRKHQ